MLGIENSKALLPDFHMLDLFIHFKRPIVVETL